MKPIPFKEQTKVFVRPGEMTDKECGSLPVYQDNRMIISCWQMSWKERIQALFTGRVWLWVWGQRQPLVFVETEYPFNQEELA